MGVVEILLVFALGWLLLEVRGLRARVSELEARGPEVERRVVFERVPFVGVGEPAEPEVAEPGEVEAVASFTHRGSRFRGNDVEEMPAVPLPAVEPLVAADELAPVADEGGTGVAGTFERLIGGRLLIWIGGAALALSGLFLVRYSIELGLIGPGVRMTLAALLGLALVGAGEVARRRVADDLRVAQALVGAGILILYASAYGGHVLYELYSLRTAFLLMALVAAAGLGLSLRHGWPAAALGLVGAFAAPALLADVNAGVEPLLGYLLLVNVAVLLVARARGWRPLLGAAVLGTALWTLPLSISADVREAWAVGGFVLGYAVAASLVLGRGADDGPPVARWLGDGGRAALFGLVQLALFTVAQNYGAFGWILFLAMCAFVVWRSDATRLPSTPAVAAVLATALVALTADDPERGRSAWVLGAATAALFLPVSAFRALRGDRRPVWPLVFAMAAAGPALALRWMLGPELPRVGWGLLLVACAALPAWLAERTGSAPDARRAGLLATAATLAGVGASDLFVADWTPLAWMLLAFGASVAARRWADRPSAGVAVATAAVAVLGVAGQLERMWWAMLGSLSAIPALVTAIPGPLRALALLGLPALVLALAAERLRPLDRRWARGAIAVAAAGGVLFAYALVKQLFALTDYEAFIDRGLAERTAINLVLLALGWAGLAGRVPRIGRDLAARLGTALTALAAARLVWFDLLIHNPLFVSQRVGAVPFFNLVLLAYGGAGAWLLAARARLSGGARGWAFAIALTALTVGALLLVRQLFQGSLLNAGAVGNGENGGYTVALLLLAVALLGWGWTRRDGPVRLAGLALLTATVVKAFLWDAAALEGVLRILSFLGLGLALIGVGRLYARLLRAPARGG